MEYKITEKIDEQNKSDKFSQFVQDYKLSNNSIISNLFSTFLTIKNICPECQNVF